MDRCSYLTKAGKLEFKVAVLLLRHRNAMRKQKQAWRNLSDALYERDFLKARMARKHEDK